MVAADERREASVCATTRWACGRLERRPSLSVISNVGRSEGEDVETMAHSSRMNAVDCRPIDRSEMRNLCGEQPVVINLSHTAADR